MYKFIKKGGVILFLLLMMTTASFASYIYGTVNESAPAEGEVSFVAFRAYDDEIVTEGVSGGNHYGPLPALTGTSDNIWYFQESSFLPSNLGVGEDWNIYFDYGAGGPAYGNDSGTWSGGNDDAENTTLAIGSNPILPEVVLTSGVGFIGFHLPTDATTYRVYRSENSSNRSYVRVDGGANGGASDVGAYWKDDTVVDGTEYFYVVVRQNSSSSTAYGSFSGHSARLSSTPGVEEVADAPAVPLGLAATAGNIEIGLEWDANTEDDVHYYKVYRGENPSPTTLLNTVYYEGIDQDAYSYTDTTVIWGSSRTYYYRITAVDFSGNESDYSSDVSETPYDTGAPSASVPSYTPFDDVGTKDGGIVYTNYNFVHLNVTGTENTFRQSQQSGIEEYKAWDSSLADPGYTTFTGAVENTIALTESDIYSGVELNTVAEGSKTINVQVKDFAANESSATTKTAWYDITTPTLGDVELNGGVEYTNSSTASLTWTYSDNCTNTGHCLKYWWNSDPEPADEDPTTSYDFSATATSTTVTFPGTGTHTLHLKVIDLATNVSSQIDSNTVTYDTSEISGTLTIEGGAVSTPISDVTLTLGTNKPEVKEESYYFISNDVDSVINQAYDDSGWVEWPVGDEVEWILDVGEPPVEGFMFVYMKIMDPAENVSDIVIASIYYGDIGDGEQTHALILESGVPGGGLGINLFSMPVAPDDEGIWYATYDLTTVEISDAYDLVLAINGAAGTNVVVNFGYWSATPPQELVRVDIPGNEPSAVITDLQAIDIEQGIGYQVYITEVPSVTMTISNQE